MMSFSFRELARKTRSRKTHSRKTHSRKTHFFRRDTAQMVNCLILGGGGREHALCDALAHAPSCEHLYALPGSQGISEMTGALCPLYGESLSSLTPSLLISFCAEHSIDLVIVGPEQFLVSGVTDALVEQGISVFAPSASAARIESSKSWMKETLSQAGIATASYQTASSLSEARGIVSGCDSFPLVIKADGLAAGKGVVIARNREQAERAVDRAMVEKCFGAAGECLLFEEFLDGEELSYFSLCDGDCEHGVRFLGVARDYKRALDGDKGLNTGGMGSFAKSAPFSERGSLEECAIRASIVRPLLQQIEKRATAYRGVLFLGLMVCSTGVKVLEVNARFGDPEAQTLLPLFEGDLAATFLVAAQGCISERERRRSSAGRDSRLFNFTEGVHSVSVVASSTGYPCSYKVGSAITDLDRYETSAETSLFHSGTELRGDGKAGLFYSTGGRVFTVNGRGSSFSTARAQAYELLERINWREGFYRKDIASERDTKAFEACCAKVLRFA